MVDGPVTGLQAISSRYLAKDEEKKLFFVTGDRDVEITVGNGPGDRNRFRTYRRREGLPTAWIRLKVT